VRSVAIKTISGQIPLKYGVYLSVADEKTQLLRLDAVVDSYWHDPWTHSLAPLLLATIHSSGPKRCK
jgi:hypothetical protein